MICRQQHIFKLMVDLPFLKKGNKYLFDYETAQVWRVGPDSKPFDMELRPALANYLWLLMTEKRYMRIQVIE